MESELSGSNSGGVISDVYNFNRTEIVGEHPAFQNFIAFEDDNKNMVFVTNTATIKENNLTCDNENLTEFKNVNGNEGEEASDVYLSTGIYLHPLTLNGNYDNIIELIDVDPNEKLDVGSPLQNKENEVLDNHQPYDVAFGCLLPINNNVVPFFNNYTKIQANTDVVQSPNMIYNTPSTTSISSENVNYKEMKKLVPPFLKRNRKPKPTNLIQPKTEPKDYVEGDEEDDVVFVKEWSLPGNGNTNLGTTDVNNTNVEPTTSSSSSPSTSGRRRRRRRTFGEKRQNPVRKAQIDKASMDLVEKLAIPSSVFNARVKGRKPKQKIVVPTTNLRQSCRTSGAILSPPRSLTEYDYKEWPADGMHERPFYDESTNNIIKYHIPDINDQCAGATRPVLLELPPVQNNQRKNCSLLTKSTRKASKKRATNNKTQNSNEFAKLSLDRLQMLFGYVQELKEFNKLAAGSENKENLRKPTLYEKSLEFRLYQNGIKENKVGRNYTKIPKGCNEENIKNVQTILSYACTLHSLADGASHKDVTHLVNNYVNKQKNCDRP